MGLLVSEVYSYSHISHHKREWREHLPVVSEALEKSNEALLSCDALLIRHLLLLLVVSFSVTLFSAAQGVSYCTMELLLYHTCSDVERTNGCCTDV